MAEGMSLLERDSVVTGGSVVSGRWFGLRSMGLEFEFRLRDCLSLALFACYHYTTIPPLVHIKLKKNLFIFTQLQNLVATSLAVK